MVETLLGQLGSFALLAAVGSVAALACSSEGDAKPERRSETTNGSIGLSLVPVSGVTLNAVSYVVTGTPAIPDCSLQLHQARPRLPRRLRLLARNGTTRWSQQTLESEL